MNKLLLAITLVFTVLATSAVADVNKTDLSDAGKNGVNALNSTLGDLNKTSAAIDAHIADFFDISNADTTEKIWKSAVVLVMGAAGFAVGIFGYKLVKPAVFICGFGFAGVFCQAVFSSLIAGTAVPVVSFILGGLIGGALFVFFYRAGIFVLGAMGGMSLGYTLAQLISASTTVTTILIIVVAIIVGVLTMYLEKPVMILSTSFYGAAIVIRVVGFFAGSYPSGADFSAETKEIKNAFWAYFAGLIVLTIIHAIVQYRVTAVGIDHGLGKNAKKEQAQAQTAAQPKTGNQPVNMV